MSFHLIRKCCVLIALIMLVASPVGAESITKEQGDAILKELKQIRKELQEIKKGSLRGPRRPARPLRAKVETKDSPVLGDPDAPITLVEFTDYQCPFCRRFYTNTLSKIKEEYIYPGKVRLVLRDLPLGFHANARPAAKAAHCAREQGKYWEMHDALFEGGGKLNGKDFSAYAEKMVWKISRFRSVWHPTVMTRPSTATLPMPARLPSAELLGLLSEKPLKTKLRVH